MAGTSRTAHPDRGWRPAPPQERKVISPSLGEVQLDHRVQPVQDTACVCQHGGRDLLPDEVALGARSRAVRPQPSRGRGSSVPSPWARPSRALFWVEHRLLRLRVWGPRAPAGTPTRPRSASAGRRWGETDSIGNVIDRLDGSNSSCSSRRGSIVDMASSSLTTADPKAIQDRSIAGAERPTQL